MTYACIAETRKMIQDVMELCAISPRMTVTVMYWGMNGNGLVKVNWGCCGVNRGRNNWML